MKLIIQKLNGFFIKTYERYYNIISLNKNLLISGIAGFIFSIFVAYYIAEFSSSHVLNSAITVISGFLTYKVIFAILFHIDNKRNYTKRLTGKINFIALRRILIKMIFASTIFDTVNNVTRFLLIIQLLKLEYSAVEAATISSLIASMVSYVMINLIVKYIHLFKQKR